MISISMLDIIGISTAFAAGDSSAQSGAAGFASMLPMFIGFGLIFYFLIIRPQNKRARDHRSLIDQVAKGDEVVTAGGILGTVNDVNDDVLVVSVAENVNIKMKKSSVANILPKGSVEEETSNS